MSKAHELGVKQNDAIDKRQTQWKCNTKTIDGSNNAHGTYCSVVEQNCKWTLEVGPQQSSKK
jgi:hypothetical protein